MVDGMPEMRMASKKREVNNRARSRKVVSPGPVVNQNQGGPLAHAARLDKLRRDLAELRREMMSVNRWLIVVACLFAAYVIANPVVMLAF